MDLAPHDVSPPADTSFVPAAPQVAVIGCGDAGRVLVGELRRQGLACRAFDVHLTRMDPAAVARARSLRDYAVRRGVTLGDTAADVVAGATLVFLAVTATAPVAVAESIAPTLAAGTFVVDLSSASPGVRRRAAAIVEAAGGRYVEAALMTSIPVFRADLPLLLGGPHASEAAPRLRALGFETRFADARLGAVSATKMCRCMLVKGLEALVIESLTAARHYGVDDAVIAALVDELPGVDWERQASYYFQRAIAHGHQRAQEMRAAADTVGDAGLEPRSTRATAELQDWMADLADAGVFGARDAPGFPPTGDWRLDSDRILAALARARPGPA